METAVYEGDAWYRHEFEADAGLESRRMFVEFEGAFQHSWVYLNGTLLGEHKGGYTGFCYDMTPALNRGDRNVLAVRVRNGWDATIAPRAGDSIFPNGLNRNVRFITTSEQHVEWCGQFITTPKVRTRSRPGNLPGHADEWERDGKISRPTESALDETCRPGTFSRPAVHEKRTGDAPVLREVSAESATVRVETDIKNEAATDASCVILVEVLDADGRVVTQSETSVSLPAGQVVSVTQDLPDIANPNLWSPDTPYLYTVRTRLSNESGLVDDYHERLGIRWFESTADNGFSLNGRPLYLWGFNVHEDRAGWAFAGTDAGMFRDMKLMKDAGANCVRACHNPHPRAFYRACDELGLLVWDELHFWGRGGFKGGEEGSYMAEAYPAVPEPRAEFEANLMSNFRDMIKERRNHPSIIVWSLGNETVMQMEEPLLSEVRRLFQELNDMAHTLDPTRITGMGEGLRGIADIEGGNGGGPQEKVGDRPILTTEFHFGHEPPRDAWRAGAICWSGIDYGTHCARPDGKSFGFFGALDYHRLPREKYYVMREQATGVPKPEMPAEGLPASLTLTADKRVVENDGTDDTQLIAAVLDHDGTLIADDIPVTFKIVSGPGLLPTGRVWETRTANMGRQAIEFRSYEAGTTVIEVSSPGVEPARVEITAVEAASETWPDMKPEGH